MRDPRPIRDLERLKWMGVVVPIALIWAWEIARFAFVDGTLPLLDEHILSALIMAGGIVLFGIVMAILLERTQREILRQNRDLTALTTVGSAVRADHSVAHMAAQALERMIEQTGALGGAIHVAGPDGEAIVIRRPEPCPHGPGLGDRAAGRGASRDLRGHLHGTRRPRHAHPRSRLRPARRGGRPDAARLPSARSGRTSRTPSSTSSPARSRRASGSSGWSRTCAGASTSAAPCTSSPSS